MLGWWYLSSILDSLKKLEKETSLQNTVPTHARGGGKSVVPKYAAGIIGIVLASAAAIYLAGHYRGVPQKQPESISRAVAPVSAPRAASDENETPPPSGQNPPAPLTASPASDPASTATAALEAKPGDSKLTARPMPTGEQGGLPDGEAEVEKAAATEAAPGEAQKEGGKALQAPDPPVPPAETDMVDSPDETPGGTNAPEKKPASMDRLEGAGFKIQAISWSENAGARLAVINNQVLREGDGIEGYHVSLINPDDIVLKRDGKSFRLDFRSTGSP